MIDLQQPGERKTKLNKKFQEGRSETEKCVRSSTSTSQQLTAPVAGGASQQSSVMPVLIAACWNVTWNYTAEQREDAAAVPLSQRGALPLAPANSNSKINQ